MAQASSADRHPVRRAVERWGPSVCMLGVALILLADGGSEGSSVMGAGVLAGLAWFVSPWFFPRSHSDASAREKAGDGEVPLIYWRPGCIYCVRLRLTLGRLGNQAVWVDVSRDGDASARVRSVNGGDETVPTVFVGGSAWVNPAPASVRGRLTTR